MKIKWNIDCGYINPMPDQELEIDDEELEDMDEEEIKDYIRESVQEEFYQKVSYYWEIVK